MSYRYQRRPERRRGRGCLVGLVVLIWVVLLGTLAYQYFLRPQISQFVGQQIGQQLNQPPAAGEQSALPTVVAALPSGEVRVSEAEANSFLAANRDSIKPLDAVTIHFVPGEVQAELKALGTTSTARMGLVAQNGRIVAQQPRIQGLLANAISADDLAASLENQINAQLAAQGRRVTDVRIEQGEIIVRIEQ